MGFTTTMVQERFSLDGELEDANLVTGERVGNMFFFLEIDFVKILLSLPSKLFPKSVCHVSMKFGHLSKVLPSSIDNFGQEK